MNFEQINQIVLDYDNLVEFAKNKIKLIETFDSKYNTRRGIDEISFEGDFINVSCDDSSMGCYDTHSFSVPMHYLLLDDEKLKETVLLDKELRIKKENRIQEEKNHQEKVNKDLRDLVQYQKLKAKFES